MQVGLGQAGALGDLGGAGAGEAGLGEDLFRRLQQPRLAGGALAAGRAEPLPGASGRPGMKNAGP